MKCQKCGTEYEGDLCQNCGETATAQNPVQTNEKQPNAKRKRPVYKKWWFWFLMSLATIITLGAVFGETEPTDTESKDSNSSSISTDNTNSSLEPELTYEEEIATYGEVNFATLSRNPDKYKGQKLKFTGQVIQVQEPTFGNTVDLRINVTKTTYEYFDDVTWSDTVYATVELEEGADRILEDDVITFYGECEGMYSYTSVLGSKVSLPKLKIKYWNLEE